MWLESVAILPQLFMLQRTGEAETITTHYLFALGAYRALYIPNWLYRYFSDGWFDPIAVVAGIVQTVLYSDFFYIYYTKYEPTHPFVPKSLLTRSFIGLCKGPSSTSRCRTLRGKSFTHERRGRADARQSAGYRCGLLWKTGLGPSRASANVMHGLAKKRGRNKGSPIIQAWEVELEKTGFSWAEAASYYLPDQCTRVTSRTQRHR